MIKQFQYHGKVYELRSTATSQGLDCELQDCDSDWQKRLEKSSLSLIEFDADQFQLNLADGSQHRGYWLKEGDRYHIHLDGQTYVFEGLSDADEQLSMGGQYKSPMPGKILEVSVEVGMQVAAGDSLLVIEAMKMENRITALQDGTISAIHCQVGDLVDTEKILLEIE